MTGSDDVVTWLAAAAAAAAAGNYPAADDAFGRARRGVRDGPERRLVRLHVARSLRFRLPTAARAQAVALVQDLAADPRALVGSPLGHAAIELTVELLLGARDRRAIAVQQLAVDAALRLGGESPGVWIERHRRGTVHARLGDHATARRLIETAMTDLLLAGEHDAAAEACRQALARLPP